MAQTEKALFSELRERVWRVERPAAVHGVLPFGVAAIDRALPGGGLTRGALHEILGAGGDEEDGALAAAFCAHILGQLTAPPASPSQPPPIPSPASPHPSPLPRAEEGMGGGGGELELELGLGLGWERGSSLSPLKGEEGKQTLSLSDPGGGEGWLPERTVGPAVRGEVGVILWCLPRPDLYGPGLAAHGLDPGRLVLVRASCDAAILWAMEEGLRSASIAAVVGEVGSLPTIASRRLQLAAERSGITAFLLRRWRNGGQAARERALPNAAATRWRIAALPSRPSRGEPGIGSPRWRVELLRCRGGEPACWEMEAPDATDHVSLAAALADRSAAPVAAEKLRRAG